MPAMICKNCGRMTNSVCSNAHEFGCEKATKCYAAFEEDKWVKGCSFDDGLCDDSYYR